MTISSFFLVFVFSILAAGTVLSQDSEERAYLSINEFMASNVLAHESAEGDYEDWIEIYNSGDAAIDLSSFYVTDSYEDRDYWQIPSGQPSQTTVPAKGYLVLYADGKTKSGGDHLGFSLSKGGEQILLIDPDGVTVLDSISFGEQFRDISFGRLEDGGTEWGYFSRITPGAANSQGYIGFVEPPRIKPESGFYDESVEVSVQPEDRGDIVRYTLDGSEPTEMSVRFTAPVRIEQTVVFKGKAFNGGALPSQTVSRPFFIDADHALPVLALTTDPPNLYDPDTGILLHDMPGRGWERFVELEFFEEGLSRFRIPAGLRIQGNTGPQEFEKKSFRAFFRGGYGGNELEFDLFPQDSIRTFTRLVLRSGYDDSMEPTDHGSARPTLLRDPLVTELWRQMGGLTPQSRFGVLYLNDEFHGIYDIKQSIDEDFVVDHMGFRDADVLRTRWDSIEVVSGDREKWDELVSLFVANSFEDDKMVEEVGGLLDLDNYMDLQALIHATQYTKWAYGVFLFRERGKGAIWKWTIWDADRAYDDVNWNGFTTLFNPLNRQLDSLVTQKLLMNRSYRERFINRQADLLNTVFSPENVKSVIDSLAENIAPDIPAEVGRWGNTVSAWGEHVDFLRRWAEQRPAIVRQQMEDVFQLDGQVELTLGIEGGKGKVQVNSAVVDRFPWTGEYFRNIPIELTAVPAEGYRFERWSDPSLPAMRTIEVNLAGDQTLSAVFRSERDVYAELITPKRIPSGQHLPIVVRIRNADGEINPMEQTSMKLAFGRARADSVIAIKRGAGTGAVRIDGDADFELTVGNDVVPSVGKRIEISDAPTVVHEGTLPAGEVVWDSSADHLVIGDITVPEDCHLILESGAWVMVGKFVNFVVKGRVSARGTEKGPVVITSADWSEPWGGMEFYGGVASFKYCMVLNGGGDLSKGFWHTLHQHIFYAANDSEFEFDHCFFLNSPGKVFGALDSRVTISNSVSSFVWHGGEFHRSLLFYRDSHLMNLPNDDHIYEEDIDTDGLHINHIHLNYPEPSVIERCYFVTGKDDAIDHHFARLQISDCWLEDFMHEGVAASGGDTVRVFNTVSLNNDQGFEAGYSDTDRGVTQGPYLFIDHSVAVGNNVGLRIGDNYFYEYRDFVRMTNSVLYDNEDNVLNYLNTTQAPLEGALEILHSMTNDPDYDDLPGNITGVPQFDPYFNLLPGSPGIGQGDDGAAMGRIGSSEIVEDHAFSSSNLPIVVISTAGVEILDEPKVGAWMGIIDNGQGKRNWVEDPFDGNEGPIGIEIRGASTRDFPKKSYSLETRDSEGGNRNVSLLGMPAENDWVLYAPYSDKSLMRNALAYWMANQMEYYASRTRFCELVMDGEYQGVYVLMEKIKRDGDRVDIANLTAENIAGDDVTGGYIVRVDRFIEGETGGWYSRYGFGESRLFYQYYYPKSSAIAPEQEEYIQGFFREFEEVLAGDRFADPDRGYARYIDAASFVDNIIVNEVARNIDAYRLSTFMYKDRDSASGRLVMGPVWDFNLGFGNINYDVHPSVPLEDSSRGLLINNRVVWYSVPFWFWWRRLVQDELFVEALSNRWGELRKGVLKTENLTGRVDEMAALLEEAQVRNFRRWPILGEYVWPNDFMGQTHAEEVDFLKGWLERRLAWMDANFLGEIRRVSDVPPDKLTEITEPIEIFPSAFHLDQNYPNPFNSSTIIRFSLPVETVVDLDIYDIAGQKVATLIQGAKSPGEYVVRWDGTDGNGGEFASGVYLYRFRTSGYVKTKKLLLMK
jgi:hypothetical protein